MSVNPLKLATRGFSYPIGGKSLSTRGFNGDPEEVTYPPSITLQPQSQAANVGSSVNFTVGVTGTVPFSYQWQKDSVNITGATGAIYGIPSVAELDEGDYSVDVSNAYGSTGSDPAYLAVNSMNEFSDTPAIGATAIVSTINPDIVLLKIGGSDPYFQVTGDLERVDVYYTHTGARQRKRIIHKGLGLTGMVKWSNYARPGLWEKRKVLVYDSDGATFNMDRSVIGSGEDILL